MMNQKYKSYLLNQFEKDRYHLSINTVNRFSS